MEKRNIPTVATVAINVKGGDLLFLDHPDASELEGGDKRMWEGAGVDVTKRPFGRVKVYVPLREDGLNRNSLRTNPAADIDGYSETCEFMLGIQDIWPYLDLFFDKRTTGIANLLAEIWEYFREEQRDHFTLSDVLKLFKEKINLPKNKREERWQDIHASTIQAVVQRFRSLPATLGGLIDVTGPGFGIDRLVDLHPYDMVVVDIERIMTNPTDPEIAESAIKIITAYILKQLTEAMTKGQCQVDHVIVFADELNRLAPRTGNGGIGEYLAQLARTTRDRGIVLFGAGQFRSGIEEDILKAASVHYSMRTPEHELNDRIYTSLLPEVKARLTQLHAGEMLVQYPSLRTAVFARFPRPFVFTGATKWRQEFAPLERPFAVCIAERLRRLDPSHSPPLAEVQRLLGGVTRQSDEHPDDVQREQKSIIEILRSIEIERSQKRHDLPQTPWVQFSALIKEKLTARDTSQEQRWHMPSNFKSSEDNW